MNLPNHLAIIPDGNRRWARKNNLPIFIGHQKGFQALKKIIKKSFQLGIKIITIWGFSTENWKRSKKEVNHLMTLFQKIISHYLKEALKNQIRLIHLGRKDRLNKTLIKKIIEVEEKTKHFNKNFLCICLDYGGKDEILRAINEILKTDIKIVDEKIFNHYLDTKNLPYPNPDLIIRTSGEQRLSGFLTWQSVYSELIFVKKYLPDFNLKDFEKCLKEYSKRQRRFGK